MDFPIPAKGLPNMANTSPEWNQNASIRMMMAIKLSDVAPDTGKERFSRAYADGGMTDNAERLEYKIEKIAMQRWLANFMQDGFEAWSDWRRLNVPKLKPGPGSTAPHIPYRKVYDTPDFNSNKDNYDAAIALQGPDTDDTRVWWDVAPND